MDPVDRVRSICLALPEVTERVSHGAPTWFAGKKVFVQAWPDGHHQDDFPHLWCAAPAGVQAEVVETEPERFFRPPYVGHRGWLGLRLDGELEEEELAALCLEAYRTVATPTLLKRLASDG